MACNFADALALSRSLFYSLSHSLSHKYILSSRLENCVRHTKDINNFRKVRILHSLGDRVLGKGARWIKAGGEGTSISAKGLIDFPRPKECIQITFIGLNLDPCSNSISFNAMESLSLSPCSHTLAGRCLKTKFRQKNEQQQQQRQRLFYSRIFLRIKIVSV